jgi:hypothetical protein
MIFANAYQTTSYRFFETKLALDTNAVLRPVGGVVFGCLGESRTSFQRNAQISVGSRGYY